MSANGTDSGTDLAGGHSQRSASPAGEVMAVEAVTRALRAAAKLRGRGTVEVDPTHVAAAIRSERLLCLDGQPLPGFAPLSRFWRAPDGSVRTHGNYPWHRNALLAALDADADGVAAAITGLRAAEVEARVYAAGGLAVAVRTAKVIPRTRVCRRHVAAAYELDGWATRLKAAPGRQPECGLVRPA